MFVILLLRRKTKKSVLKRKKRHSKKLSDLIPCYEINQTRFSNDPKIKLFLVFLYVS